MNVHLLFSDRDFPAEQEARWDRETIVSDLELQMVLDAMSGDDRVIAETCSAVLLTPLQTAEEVVYRQEILQDVLERPELAEQIYALCGEAEKRWSDSWYMVSGRWVSNLFTSAVGLLEIDMEMLHKLRELADTYGGAVRSRGLRALFADLQENLPDDYFTQVTRLLEELRASGGTLISARFGSFLQGVDYVYRRRSDAGFRLHWWRAPAYTIGERDDAGAADLRRRCERAINEPANALAQAADSLRSYFTGLRRETAFYMGCLNLRAALAKTAVPICFPAVGAERRSWTGLRDISLVLLRGDAVGNDFAGTGKPLCIITGANQGGKTTFLRSLGQAQLMAQCGMFVAASAFSSPLCRQVFTHFKKEEDVRMNSGKLDEELGRMSRIADHLRPGSLVLLNESFSSTNEREGSEICGQIVRALVESGVEVAAVTHLYAFASAFLGTAYTQFLRAQRLESGERTFRLEPGEPTPTAFGADLCRQIFD